MSSEKIESYIPQGYDAYGRDGGMTPDGCHVPKQAMMEILALRRQVQSHLVDPKLTFRYSRVWGENIDEMREKLYQTPLYSMGDALLIWVNEGDLSMLTYICNVLLYEINN